MEKAEALRMLRKGWIDGIQLSAEELQAVDGVREKLESAMYTLARVAGVLPELTRMKVFDVDYLRRVIDQAESPQIPANAIASYNAYQDAHEAEEAQGSRVRISIFKVHDDFRDARGLLPHGQLCAQYIDGNTCVFTWADDEDTAIMRLKEKLRELFLDQRLAWVKSLEIEL
jgi:hypothetical protein